MTQILGGADFVQFDPFGELFEGEGNAEAALEVVLPEPSADFGCFWVFLGSCLHPFIYPSKTLKTLVISKYIKILILTYLDPQEVFKNVWKYLLINVIGNT